MLRPIILLMVVSASGPVLSAQIVHKGDIMKTLVDNEKFGGCMVRIAPGPEKTLSTCSKHWATFSCSGDFNSKSEGGLKFQSAQLAMLSGKPVAVTLDDSKKHNGYCFVRRIDVE
jgi:hypothetical protein